MVKRDKPLVLTVSPPCTFFCIANQGPVSPVDLAGAKELMRFAVEMCELQLKENGTLCSNSLSPPEPGRLNRS